MGIIPEESSNIFGTPLNDRLRDGNQVDIPEKGDNNIAAQMEEENNSSSSSEKSDPLEGLKFVPTTQRRRSFEISNKNMLTFPLVQSYEGEEIEILEDPNTFEPNTTLNRPRWSKANDDTEFLRRKKEAKKRRLMRFLYAGDLPQKNKNDKKLLRHEALNVGSDVTPEKEELLHQLKFPSQGNSGRDVDNLFNEKEEDKEELNIISGIQSIISGSEEAPFQTEQPYDLNNPLDSRMSDNVNRDTVRSQNPGVLDDKKRTDGDNQLEKMYRQFEQDQERNLDENLEIVHEVISQKLSKSVVSEAVFSSDQSVAAPPISDNESESNVVMQGLDVHNNIIAVSSKSGGERESEPEEEVPKSNFD